MRFRAPANEPPVFHKYTPENIDDRVENLKRRPTYLSYFSKHSFDEEDEDDDYIPWTAKSQHKISHWSFTSFVIGIFWAILHCIQALIVTMVGAFASPVVILVGCLDGVTPYGGKVAWTFLMFTIRNVACLMLILGTFYHYLFRSFDEIRLISTYMLTIKWEELLNRTQTCIAFLVEKGPLWHPNCYPMMIDFGVLLIVCYGVLYFYKKSTMYLSIIIWFGYFTTQHNEVERWFSTEARIEALDPPFAVLQEPITIRIEGQYLKHGGYIAWVPFWGCASADRIGNCEKQFETQLQYGTISKVTFSSIDEYIPCYKEPMDPLKVHEYVCFEHLRLRVKDPQSIPGWSKKVKLDAKTGTIVNKD